jgi:hypothetical protein
MRSSVMLLEKAAWSRPGLRSANGRTAIELLCIPPNSVPAGPGERRARKKKPAASAITPRSQQADSASRRPLFRRSAAFAPRVSLRVAGGRFHGRDRRQEDFWV